jgi:ubiquinone/menaquinone biosynthesis C-methylase UbiE
MTESDVERDGALGRRGRRAAAPSAATESLARYYDSLAPHYDRSIAMMERLFLGGGRRWIGSRARGDVLDVAIGTGRTLDFYPEEVRLTGIDLSPRMLELARARSARLGRTVELRLGDAERLPFADESFDTVVFTLALCTIPEDETALAEAHRVLRPEGSLLLLEHVRSPHLVVRTMQRLADPLFARFAHDHLLRDPAPHLETAGFKMEELERLKWGFVERVRATKLQAIKEAPGPAFSRDRGSSPHQDI